MLEEVEELDLVAILEPVELAGVTVKRATLNNMDDIIRKGVRIGADVFVSRSNDVIPEIMGVVPESLEGSEEIKAPVLCPACGSHLVLDGAHYFCENTLSCKPQIGKKHSSLCIKRSNEYCRIF